MVDQPADRKASRLMHPHSESSGVIYGKMSRLVSPALRWSCRQRTRSMCWKRRLCWSRSPSTTKVMPSATRRKFNLEIALPAVQQKLVSTEQTGCGFPMTRSPGAGDRPC